MGIPIPVEEHPFRTGKLEQFFLLCFLLVAALVIGFLTLATHLVQCIAKLTDGDFAGPYRQVR